MTSKTASPTGPVTSSPGRDRALQQVPPRERLAPDGWWLDLALLGVILLVTGALLIAWRPILATDIWVRDLSSEHRPYWPDTIAANLERLGQGGPLAGLCFAISLLMSWRRRSIEPTLAIVVAFFLSYGTIGTIKVFTDRPMPYRGSVELFTSPHQLAYPSGHASNGVLWYGMLLLLLGHLMWPWLRTFVRWFPPIVVSFTTVYLGHHWVTDVITGMAIGLIIERLVRRRLWRESPWLMQKLRLEPDEPDASGDRTASVTTGTGRAASNRSESASDGRSSDGDGLPGEDKSSAEDEAERLVRSEQQLASR